LIEIAKISPSEAKNFRNLVLFGRIDVKSVQEVNTLLTDVGIPLEFLAP
jgi:hypothetical protein